MRNYPIVTVLVLVIIGMSVASYFSHDDTTPPPVKVIQPDPSSSSTPSPNTSIRDDRRDLPSNLEQQQLRLMSDRVADLEARLRDMEANAHGSLQGQPASLPTEAESDKTAEKTNPKKLSESDLGQWMDNALNTGDFDRNTTKAMVEQMTTSLAEVPGVNLADLQCGERFCRANFTSDDGKAPNIAQVMGASPFIESGFTIAEPDGGVKVYFTQPGESLSDLRSEAQEATLGDMPLN